MRYLKYSSGKNLGALQTTTNAPWNVPRLVRYAESHTPIKVTRGK
jgi:hypothetical protein